LRYSDIEVVINDGRYAPITDALFFDGTGLPFHNAGEFCFRFLISPTTEMYSLVWEMTMETDLTADAFPCTCDVPTTSCESGVWRDRADKLRAANDEAILRMMSAQNNDEIWAVVDSLRLTKD
jgi:hypothetical protein